MIIWKHSHSACHLCSMTIRGTIGNKYCGNVIVNVMLKDSIIFDHISCDYPTFCSLFFQLLQTLASYSLKNQFNQTLVFKGWLRFSIISRTSCKHVCKLYDRREMKGKHSLKFHCNDSIWQCYLMFFLVSWSRTCD